MGSAAAALISNGAGGGALAVADRLRGWPQSTPDRRRSRRAPALAARHCRNAVTSTACCPAAHAATLITFWASWCAACTREAPALERFSSSPRSASRLPGGWGVAGATACSARARFVPTRLDVPVLRDGGEGTVGND